jgi:hypothetical protein
MHIAAKAVVPLAIAAALIPAGCGGDGEESATTSAMSGSQSLERASTERHTSTAKQGGPKEDQSPSSEGKKTEGGNSRQSSVSPPTTTASLANEGSKRAAPGVPTNEGGDNSIQTYGAEAPASERIDAAIALQAYLDARAAEDWATACSYLSSSNQKLMEKFAERLPRLKGERCPQVLAALTGNSPGSVLTAEARIEVISFRVEDDHAFIIYRDSRGMVIAISMALEDGGWKLGSLSGVPLG